MNLHLPGIATPGRTDAPQVLEDLEVDYSPVAVPLQLLLGLQATFADIGVTWTPQHVLCPAAGSGAYPRAIRAIWEHAHITGIDNRASEAANLAAACDAFSIGDIFDDQGGAARGRLFDFIAENPPFCAFGIPEKVAKRVRYWPEHFARHNMLSPRGLLAMYGLTQFGQGEEAAAFLRIWAPFLCIRCGGRPQHRGVGTQREVAIPERRRVPGGPTTELRDNGGDSREYCLWVWRRQDFGRVVARPSWTTVQLPVLPVELRTWHPSAVPGTYPLDAALVEEVRRYVG